MRKNKKVPLVIIGLVVGVLIFGSYFGFFSILPEETRTLDWNGIPVKVTTAFGSFVNNQTFGFCGSNDADVRITNEINTNGKLISNSTLVTSSRACVQGQPIAPNYNKIFIEMILPAGELTASCLETQSVATENYGFSEYGNDLSACTILIDGQYFASGSGTLSNTIILSKNSKVTVEQIERTGDVGTSYTVKSLATLDFKKLENSSCSSFTYSPWSICNGTQQRQVINSYPVGCLGGTPIISQTCTPVCINGQTQSCAVQNGVGSKSCNNNTYSSCIVNSCNEGYKMSGDACVFITQEVKSYYRFANNLCSQVNLSANQVTSSDYLTLNACQANISNVPAQKNPYIFWAITGVILVLLLIMIIYLIFRRKQ